MSTRLQPPLVPGVPAVELIDVRRSYGRPPATVEALAGVSHSFAAGSFTAVMGPSGSGKSTLLMCAAGLEAPTSGEVRLAGLSLAGLSERERTEVRRDRVGFVFQSFQLIESLTAAQNVALPLRLAGRRPDRARLRSSLSAVGLADRADTARPNCRGQQRK